MTYDIFISYKRKSLATANNLNNRLTTRGYSTFFDLDEMKKDNFDVQLLHYIENAKNVSDVVAVGGMRKRIVVRLEDTHPNNQKTSGLGLRLIIRKNIERQNVYTFF